jgi:hydrogenase maturation factor
LLASVPAEEAEAIIKALQAAGYSRTSIIGEVVARASEDDFEIIIR